MNNKEIEEHSENLKQKEKEMIEYFKNIKPETFDDLEVQKILLKGQEDSENIDE